MNWGYFSPSQCYDSTHPAPQHLQCCGAGAETLQHTEINSRSIANAAERILRLFTAALQMLRSRECNWEIFLSIANAA